MTLRDVLVCALLLLAALAAPLARAQTYVIPFSELSQLAEGSGESPDRLIEGYLAGLIRDELDALGFDVDAGLVLDDLPIEASTEIIQTNCNIYQPYEVHNDATTATVTIDESSSLTVNVDGIRSVSLQAELSGTVSAEGSAWVRWGQDILFIGDCVRIDTDHGRIGLTVPFDITLDLALQLEPSYDAAELAIVVDKQATLTGQAVVGQGSLSHDFGTISLTDLVLNFFEDRLLDDVSERSEQAIAAAISEQNFRLDGRDENGEPDPSIVAFNGPSTFYLDVDDDDRASIREFLAAYGIPEIVLDLVEARGIDILLTLVTLDDAERELLLAELGAAASCDVLLAAFGLPPNATPLYTVSDQVCGVADPVGSAPGPYYSDAACTDEIAWEPTSNAAYCAEGFGSAAAALLGNAAAWTPVAEQPNDPLPGVPSRPWTLTPGSRLDLGLLPLSARRQPYMKRLRYKAIDGVPRGAGRCELEMRVYKQDPAATGLTPLLAVHGGTWRSRGFSFLGMEAGLAELTERGFIVFAPFYRLVGEDDGNVECNGASWREVTADVESALDWVLANGAALGAADGPVSAYGQSAGAHLAGWLAANRAADLRSAALFYGPTDALGFLAGALASGGPYAAYREFGLSSLTRFYGARRDVNEVRLTEIAPSDFTVERMRDEFAVAIPDSVFDLAELNPLAPSPHLLRCAAQSAVDLAQIDPLAPPRALLDCLKQDLGEFLVANSFNHQLADEPAAVHLVQGSADTLVPYNQALELCGAIDGRVLPTTVPDPLTVYDCGEASQAQIVWGADHALELGVCLAGLCPAGEPGSLTRDATAAAIVAAYDWLQADQSLPGTPTGYEDVAESYWAFEFIQALAENGIGTRCSPGRYCPDAAMIRSHMAVFLERAMRGGGYLPPAATGAVFADVAAGDFAADFIEQLYADGITSGCGGGNYCPESRVTRAQMAVFLLRARYGAAYRPPPATGARFGDVGASYWAAAWIEQLAAEGITGGCGGGLYCPEAVITRAQMAVFLVRMFDLL